MEEAVTCYKVGAYRSAYLMSYLAFKTTIRERVLNASKPDGIEDRCWKEQILAHIIYLKDIAYLPKHKILKDHPAYNSKTVLL